MSVLSRFAAGLRALLRRRKADQELDDELQAYLDAAAEHHVASGMSADAARRAARVSVGSVEAVKDHTRDIGWESIVGALRQDVRYGLRTLAKAPTFTVVAVGTLAVGIGATTAIFTLVNALLLAPLPFRDPSRLMLVHLTAPDDDGAPGLVRKVVWSYPKYQRFRETQQIFEPPALFDGREWSLTGTAEPERLRGELISASYLSTLGVTPSLGRDFTPEEDRQPGINGVVLLGHGLWQRRFGGNPGVLGQVIGLDSIPYTVVGVLPPGFRGMTGEAQVWVPVTTLPADRLEQRYMHSYYMVARRKPSVSEQQARTTVAQLGAAIDAAFPNPRGGPHWGATGTTLDSERVDPLIGRSTLVLFGVVVFVLLIGCVNLANLLLARSLARQREVAMRLAIGATRARLVRQFLTESLLLAGAGAVSGIAVAYGTLRLAAALLPEAGVVVRSASFDLTHLGVNQIRIDPTTLAFTLAVTVATAVLFGLAPAWRATRIDILGTMKAGGSGSIAHGPRVAGLRNLLIVGETALALVLLVASGLMIQSVRNLQRTELGFVPDRLVTADLSLPTRRYDAGRMTQFFVDLQDRVRSLPGVESVAFSNTSPVSGDRSSTTVWFPDQPSVPPGSESLIGVHWTSPGYFSTMGIRVLKGRTFTDRDRTGTPRVVVINETAARSLFKGEDPIGRRIAMGFSRGGFGGNDGAEVIGIVNDVRYESVERAANSDAYVSLLQSPVDEGVLLIRSPLDPGALAPMIRREVAALDPDLPVEHIKTMRDRFGDATWRTRLSADLLALFAAVALALAAIGLYGVMAQAVEQRAREIGVRLALGADRASIFTLVMRRALSSTIGGIAAGGMLALTFTRFLEPLLYRVSRNNPAMFALDAAILLGVSVLAACIPARRASRVDPLTSLRAE
jgi:putative ABC transport system permease protein